MKESMLSTIDNPYDPFDDFDRWYKFDIAKGYNCCSYLSRISKTSDDLPEIANQNEIERAIDEIVKINVNGMYCKVTREYD